MKTYSPSLPFKGNRTYVHGTTLYMAVLKGARESGLGEPDGPMTIDYRRKLTAGADIIYLDGNSDSGRPETAVADFNLTFGERRIGGWIASNDQSISERVEYDEDTIRASAAIDGQTIRQTGEPGSLPVEVCTSMAVMLHDRLFPLENGKRWMLARLHLDRPLATGDIPGMELILKQNAGGAFTRSDLLAGGRPLGNLSFMAG